MCSSLVTANQQDSRVDVVYGTDLGSKVDMKSTIDA